MLYYLVAAALVLSANAQRPWVLQLTVTNGAKDGVFFRDEFCPTGTYAAGFQLLVSIIWNRFNHNCED